MGVLVTSAGNSSSLLLLLLCSHLSLSASPGVLEQILEGEKEGHILLLLPCSADNYHQLKGQMLL